MCLQAGGIFSLADACLHDQIFHLVSQPSPAPPQCPRRPCRGCLATLDFFWDIGLCLGLCLSNICGGYLLPALHLPCHQVYLPNDGALSYTLSVFLRSSPRLLLLASALSCFSLLAIGLALNAALTSTNAPTTSVSLALKYTLPILTLGVLAIVVRRALAKVQEKGGKRIKTKV